MIILKPISHQTIWGGDFFTKYSTDKATQLGHLYSAIDSGGLSNEILNRHGLTLHEYFTACKKSFSLEKYPEFPIVVAMVDAAENLSIQVHPDDKAAEELESATFGKNESWYFLRRPKSGTIFNGSRIKSKNEIVHLLKTGRGSEIYDELEINVGDYVYIQAGTLHALSAGSIVYEIEENSEYTYRLFDFDRVDSTGNKRALHIDKAIRALQPELKSTVKHYNGGRIIERMYSTQLLTDVRRYHNDSDKLDCVTILDQDFDELIDNCRVIFGTSIILEPDESVELTASAIMSARIF